jgi:hypothetical protein
MLHQYIRPLAETLFPRITRTSELQADIMRYDRNAVKFVLENSTRKRTDRVQALFRLQGGDPRDVGWQQSLACEYAVDSCMHPKGSVW